MTQKRGISLADTAFLVHSIHCHVHERTSAQKRSLLRFLLLVADLGYVMVTEESKPAVERRVRGTVPLKFLPQLVTRRSCSGNAANVCF